ncbi:MAG: hypothetical protein KIS68_14850 [Bauldia sp.]|nr:hypothetical protein [Bauldia sp.]
MTGSRNQPIPNEDDVAAAAEKLRQARLADEARRGKENAIAAGRGDGTGKSPGEGDPVEKKAPGKPTADVKEPAPGPKEPPGKSAR